MSELLNKINIVIYSYQIDEDKYLEDSIYTTEKVENSFTDYEK